MRANDVVVAAGDNIVVHAVCTGGDVFVDGRSLAEQVVFFFCLFVAGTENLRRVQVNPRMPVGDEFGGAFGDKQQRVINIAHVAAALIDLLNGFCAGIVSGSGVAA